MKIVIRLTLLFMLMASNVIMASTWQDNISLKADLAEKLNCIIYPNIENIQNRFACEEALLDVSNALYNGWLKSNKLDKKDDLLRFWNKGVLKDDAIKNIFMNPMVRLNVASLIGQLNVLTTSSIDSNEYRDYVISFIHDENTMLRVDSIDALGWVGKKEDVSLLLKIIREEKEGLAESAVLSIINLLKGYHSCKLCEINKLVKRESLKAFINDKLIRQTMCID
jgi:hypothetical protein